MLVSEANEKHQFCNSLNIYLMERFGYKKLCASPSSGVNITARRHKFDLYIRVFEMGNVYWGGKAIVISRIEFIKKRKGNGSNFLQFIIDFAQKNQYEVIGIEQATTPEIHSFAQKHRFSKIENSDNYSLAVKQLSK
ncbi:hypothetical protein LG301_10200 [Vreelandella venusta]|uniref:hypothetical protein n=1 Tax=Vreelandella venusta TaxID=44935 RepID=UPI0038500837